MRTVHSSTQLKSENPQKSARFDKDISLGHLPIMSQQLKKRSFIVHTKNIKNNTKQSFQRQLADVQSFNTYIDKEYTRMKKQKVQNPTLMIPSGFQQFVLSKLFHNFLQKLYEYMDILIQYEKKFDHIKDVTSKFQPTERYEPGLKKLRFETNHLQQKCKEVSYVYMGILLSHGQSKRIFKDQYFFETMIYFVSQILKSVFDQEQHALIEEELNRMFRTTAFNLIKRRHDEDSTYEKYPALKQAKYDSSNHGVNRMIRRLSIHRKFNYSVQVKPENSQRLKKPLEINLSALGSVKSRSPLISSFYPSEKQKLFQFGKSARDKQELIKQARVSTSFFYRK